MYRYELPDILYTSLKVMGGRATIIETCKYICGQYENELKKSGDLFYSWQYDIRRAATELRKTGRMKSGKISPKGIWEIV